MLATIPLEPTISYFVQWLRLGVETAGAIIVAVGIIATVYRFLLLLRHPESSTYNRVRLTLSRYLVVALEFQLAADILSTAIAPSWQEIGKLGAIAVIRTGLNFFLVREMREEMAGLHPVVDPLQSTP